jgi:hypothetical protein
LKTNGLGDALLFPFYSGYFENYFTISNKANSWIQGHLRFRGAAWSAEMRDFDVILSPGDVLVFRVADMDGDGMWEIDQTLEECDSSKTEQDVPAPCSVPYIQNNFRYTGIWASADMPFTCKDDGGNPIVGCMEQSDDLVPDPVRHAQYGVTEERLNALWITPEVREYQKQFGYVEFIGEAVLDGMTHGIMSDLLNKANQPYQTRVFNQRGTTAWAWSDADGSQGTKGNAPFSDDQGLSDVPNVLSGTAFIVPIGQSEGLAYNAEALANFRTATRGDPDNPDPVPADGFNIYQIGEHRIDNYRTRNGGSIDTVNGYGELRGNSHPKEGNTLGFSPLAENRAVIVHDDNGAVSHASGSSPAGDYVYAFGLNIENSEFEGRISFNNTWGPTLADGDDYLMTNYFQTINGGNRNAYGGVNDLRWTSSAGIRCSFLRLPSDRNSNEQYDDYDCSVLANNSSVSENDATNSIAEVEEAIRQIGQDFTGYYMDKSFFDGGKVRSNYVTQGENEPPLTTQYFAFFPTKFFAGEAPVLYLATADGSKVSFWNYTLDVINNLIVFSIKNVKPQVWDTKEHAIGAPSFACISPSTLEECYGTTEVSFPFELHWMSVSSLKKIMAPDVTTGFEAGRTVFDLYPEARINPRRQDIYMGFPGLMYSFESSPDPQEAFPTVITNWRSLQR